VLKLLEKCTTSSGSKILTFKSNITSYHIAYHSQTKNNPLSICDNCGTEIYNAIIHIENSSIINLCTTDVTNRTQVIFSL